MDEPYPLKGAIVPRLFVDIDDTLIFWKRSANKNFYDTYEVNFEVYEAVKRFRDKHPDGNVIFWSSGGGDYARKWVLEQTPELAEGEKVSFISKYPAIPFTGDIFIDDEKGRYPWAKLAIHPREAGTLFR